MLIKKNFLIVFLSVFFLGSTTVLSQERAIETIIKKGNEFTLQQNGSTIKIEFCSPKVFRVRYSATGTFAAQENYMVSQYNWASVQLSHSENQNKITISSDSLKLEIQKSPFLVQVYNHKGILINEDALPAQIKGEAKTVTKSMQANEHFFGFGERMDFLDRKGKKLRLNVGRGEGLPHEVGAYNVLEANYCPVTFFMSTKGYGIYLHTSYASNWDMGASNPNQYSFAPENGELDYYFIYGPSFPSLIQDYTSITGKAPLMPKFALGLHVGTYSGGTWGHEEMTSTQYVIALAQKLRQQNIPADIIWLDSTWRLFGENGGKGATTFEWRETFKNPKAMFDSIYAMDYKMVGLHLRPRFDNAKKLNLLDQARKKGFTYPEDGKPGEFVNFFDEKAVDWWWENGVMRVAKQGAMFLKTDEGSAFGHKANESDKVGPTGQEAERLHNIFPIAYAKAPYEKFQELNKIRGLNQTREGYAGIQRYPFIFAGDWPSEWQYFAPVIKAGLNIGLSGVSNWAHCMGGFEHPADPELYIRWVQFGMLSPVALVFGMDHPGYKEPWNYGEDALRNFKNYDKLRYRLLPYLYASMYQNHQTGIPMMRALVLNHQDDVNTYNIDDQYLLGDNLMVCPVTVKAAKTRSLYLPKGEWYNYWTGKKITGSQYIHVVAPLDTIPLFVRGGGIIPMQQDMKFTDEQVVKNITLAVYPSGKSEFNLYEDDGKTLDYQKGKFATTKITSEETKDAVKITVSKPVGDYQPLAQQFKLQVYGFKQKPSSVKVNHQEIPLSSWEFNSHKGYVTLEAAGAFEVTIK
jgi:alpha-glucosidase (family GH31 glycosyl hydrolase)